MLPAIYLASGSPRRSELLTQLCVCFSVIKAPIEEVKLASESAEQYVLRLALEKAQAGWQSSKQDRPVLGADTIVVYKQQILEKPQDQLHAKEMMQLLSGKTHQVFTAVAVVDKQHQQQVLVKTDVTFKTLSEQEITDYWLTGEPLDKAGGYGIQGLAGRFITNISGSYTAVVGLPLYETEQLLIGFSKYYK